MRTHRAIGTVTAIVLVMLLTGCGKRLSGVYIGKFDMGMPMEISVEFSSSGTAFVRVMGSESAGKYRIEGQRIIVEMPNQNSVFTIVDNDTITTDLPYGEAVLKRKR